MLLQTIKADMTSALKSGDKVRLGTLRFLIAAVQNAGTAKYGAASDASVIDADVLDAVKKLVRTHKESIELFTKAGRMELVEKEKAELQILSALLPKELSDEDLKNLLLPVIGSPEADLPDGKKDFGKLMKQAMTAVAGKADGGRVAGILKQMLPK